IVLLPVSKTLGYFILGLGTAFKGLSLLSLGAMPLTDSKIFYQAMNISVNHPMVGVIFGVISTAIIQSSSVIIGILIALAQNDLLELQAALPIILGSNLGTCITAFLASFGSGRTAKQVALAHGLLNVLGIIVFYPILGPFASLTSLTSPSIPRQIANAHTLYNFLSSVLVLPFSKYFSKLVMIIFPNS
ncbi:MAG: Na/Pi cotransporter family protein, partial [Clostridia bacterium]|nr:Na/Pi cotransporter family protein [Clostridia bacterium]